MNDELNNFQTSYVAGINTKLAKLHDQGARWWSYIASHSTFDIVIGDPLGRERNLILCLQGCDRIAGPIIWENQRIEVILTSEEPHDSYGSSNRYILRDESYYILRDEAVGFHAEGIKLWCCQNFDIHKYGSLLFRRKPQSRNCIVEKQNKQPND